MDTETARGGRAEPFGSHTQNRIIQSWGQDCTRTSPGPFLGKPAQATHAPLFQPLPVGLLAAGSDVLITSKACFATWPRSLGQRSAVCLLEAGGRMVRLSDDRSQGGGRPSLGPGHTHSRVSRWGLGGARDAETTAPPATHTRTLPLSLYTQLLWRFLNQLPWPSGVSGLFLPFGDSEGDLSRWWEVGGWIRTPREQATRRKGVGVRQGRKPPLKRMLALPSRAASSRPRVVCGQWAGDPRKGTRRRGWPPCSPLALSSSLSVHQLQASRRATHRL